MEQNTINFMIILTWVFVLFLIHKISQFMDSKKKYYNAISKKEKKSDYIVERVNSTASFLKLLDTLVTIEVDNVIIGCKLVKTPYKVLNLDRDVKQITTKVFESIKPELYSNTELCVNRDFLLSFITTQVSNKFIQSMMVNNIEIYAQNAEEGPVE